jgi:hypothetical protein
MSASRMLWAMVAGSGLVIVVGSRSSPPPEAATTEAQRPAEAPWLTPEAAAQIVAPGGNLGSLFSGIELGGPPPSPAVRARIAEFARANHVGIDLDVVDGELAAVRFDVTYPGCCGYEGADVLAMRFGRPKSESCCVCGESSWVNDWANVSEDGSVHMRARVRVNRVQVRWEPELALSDVIDRADALLGQDRATVGDAARDHWVEVEAHRSYLLEIPYQFVESYGFMGRQRLGDRDDLGIHLVVDQRRITEVTFALSRLEDATELRASLRARWGRPRVKEGTWTWRKPDRIITAEVDGGRMTIAKR